MAGIVGGPVRVGPTLGMRVIIGIPRPLSRRAMNHALEALVRINADWLRENPGAPPLYESGVRYAVEPTGYELWDPYALLLARGAGDCDDLACARAAELRERHGEWNARADCYPSSIKNGRRTWHAIVVRADGTVEDPSARLGMPTHAGHLNEGEPFSVVLREHEHLEGDDAGDGWRASAAGAAGDDGHGNDGGSMEIKWEVKPLQGGGWEGTIWIPAGRGGAMAVSQRARSPGDALEAALTFADRTMQAIQGAGLDEQAGMFDFGRMIPGLLSTGAELVRTFTGGPSSPSPAGLPAALAPLATTAMMRAPTGYAPAPPAPPGYGYAPPMYAAPPAPYGYAPPAPPYGGGWK